MKNKPHYVNLMSDRDVDEIKSMIKDFYDDELISYSFYKFLGDRAKDNKRETFHKMSEMELEHSRIWKDDIGSEYQINEKLTFSSKIRLFFLKLMAVILPLSFMINYIELDERGALQKYMDMLHKFKHSDDKIKELITGIMKDEILHEATLTKFMLGETSKISNLKEAIYGMTDSLVEILALVIGLASIMNNLLLIGLSGLLASIGGTFSMVSGAYLSVQTQNDIYDGQLSDLHSKHKVGAEYVTDDLVASLDDKGLEHSVSVEIAKKIEQDDNALLGLAEAIIIEEEKSDPKTAAVTTGIYYILGALPAFLPFFFAIPFDLAPLQAAIIAVGLSALLAFIAGIFTAVLSGISIGTKGIKNVIITIGAALATYAFGTIARGLLGINV